MLSVVVGGSTDQLTTTTFKLTAFQLGPLSDNNQQQETGETTTLLIWVV
jgi:hypothetical protein